MSSCLLRKILQKVRLNENLREWFMLPLRYRNFHANKLRQKHMGLNSVENVSELHKKRVTFN